MSICSVGVKILVPIDGSKHSERALETAVEIAKKFDGKLTLINIVSPFSVPLSSMVYVAVPEADLAAAEKAVIKAGEKLLADAKEGVNAEGVRVKTLLKVDIRSVR